MTAERDRSAFSIRQTRRNILTTYAARLVGLLSLLVVLPLIIGKFGAEPTALYLLVTTIVALLQTDLGLMAGGVRSIGRSYVSGDERQLAADVATSHAFFACLALVSCALYCGVFAAFWDKIDMPVTLESTGRLLVMFGAMQLVLTIASTSIRQVLIAVGRLDTANGIVIVQATARLIGCVVITQFDVAIWALGAVDAAVSALALVASLLARRRIAPECAGRFRSVSAKAGRSMIRLNGSLLLLSISGLIVMQAGSLVVSATLPLAAVTAYAAGFRCYQACKEITNSLTAALLPAATRLDAEGRAAVLRTIYLKATAVAGAVQLAALIPVMAFATPILEIWLGERLDGAGSVTVLLLLSLVISNNHLVAIPLLTARGRVGAYALMHAVWALSAIGIGVFLAPRMGPEGMALGFCLPIVLLEAFYVWIVLDELNIRWREFGRQVLYPVILPSALAVVWCLSTSKWVEAEHIFRSLLIALSATAIFLLCYWKCGLSPTDRQQIKHLRLKSKGMPS
ncbi:lipopolysaccharide biosynthesis protein [Aeromicrobium wangtongii]|uniref:lipopolysaccharide biosynthesis protein n=1 Tax=Aeromicrobium wangtongii TaxID=2969247 RepID=UPI002017E783|nr:hypothetical protein [Aeromicrobium wangtongii]MCL3817239.1 hypothetical protein [Aeromicrobium wangtongii]